jgi:hypothetical protein
MSAKSLIFTIEIFLPELDVKASKDTWKSWSSLINTVESSPNLIEETPKSPFAKASMKMRSHIFKVTLGQLLKNSLAISFLKDVCA